MAIVVQAVRGIVRQRTGVLLAVVSVLVGTSGIQGAAAEPAVALEVNAIPGVAIDICDGGHEVHSRQPYTWRNIWGPIDPPSQSWTIRRASPGECTGVALGRFHATFDPGKTYAVVYWRPRRDRVRMRIFETKSRADGEGDVALELHHVAKAGRVRARIRQRLLTPTPTDITGLGKGMAADVVLPASSVRVHMTPKTESSRWATSRGHIDDVEAGVAYEAFFMGSDQDDMTVAIWPAAALPVEPALSGGRRRDHRGASTRSTEAQRK